MGILKNTSKDHEIVNAVIGFKYEMFPIFLDKRGQFVENCRKIFIPGTPLNINLDFPEGIRIQSKNPPIEISFSAGKTVISQSKFFSLSDFKSLTLQFHTHLKDLYTNCKFEYVGVVVTANFTTQNKPLEDLADVIAIFSKRYKISTGYIKEMKLTYTKDVFRFHLQSSIKDSSKGIYTIALDTQRIVDATFDDITTILDKSNSEFDMLTKKLQE